MESGEYMQLDETDLFLKDNFIDELISDVNSIYNEICKIPRGIINDSIIQFLFSGKDIEFHVFPKIKPEFWDLIEYFPSRIALSPVLLFSMMQDMMYCQNHNFSRLISQYSAKFPIKSINFEIWISIVVESAVISPMNLPHLLCSVYSNIFYSENPDCKINECLALLFLLAISLMNEKGFPINFMESLNRANVFNIDSISANNIVGLVLANIEIKRLSSLIDILDPTLFNHPLTDAIYRHVICSSLQHPIVSNVEDFLSNISGIMSSFKFHCLKTPSFRSIASISLTCIAKYSLYISHNTENVEHKIFLKNIPKLLQFRWDGVEMSEVFRLTEQIAVITKLFQLLEHSKL